MSVISYWLRDAIDLPYQWRRLRWTYQRSRRGWSDMDLVDLGPYWLGLMIGSLEAFARDPRGYPSGLREGSTIEEAEKEWKRILTEILDGLKAAKHLNWDCDCTDLTECHSRYDEHKAKLKRSMELLGEWMLAIWD